LPLFIIGIIAVVFHSISPDTVPYSLDTILGAVMIVLFFIWTTMWIVTENSKTPAVVRFDADEDGITRAAPEIKFLLEDGWDVKRVVDMVSANYQITPKLVYEHVMDLIASNPRLQHQPPEEDAIRTSQQARFSIQGNSKSKDDFVIDTGKFRED